MRSFSHEFFFRIDVDPTPSISCFVFEFLDKASSPMVYGARFVFFYKLFVPAERHPDEEEELDTNDL